MATLEVTSRRESTHSSHSAAASPLEGGEHDQNSASECASLGRLYFRAKVLAMLGAPLVSVCTYLYGREQGGGVRQRIVNREEENVIQRSTYDCNEARNAVHKIAAGCAFCAVVCDLGRNVVRTLILQP